MTDLRVLVTGRTESHVLSALRRAVALLDDHGRDGSGEIVVATTRTPRHRALVDAIEADSRVRVLLRHGRDEAELLDAGLFLRPLPTTVAVVSDTSHWVGDIALVGTLLTTAGVGAVVLGGSGAVEVQDVVRDGGVFAAGPLCTAGGFGEHHALVVDGDDQRSLARRLADIGYTTVELANRRPSAGGTTLPEARPAVPAP